MNFLEARRFLQNFTGGDPLPFLLAMSGTSDPLELYLRACGAQLGRSTEVRTLPFNTLGQWLFSEPRGGEVEVVLLMPWDLVPALDWRSGVAASAPDLQRVRDNVEATVERLTRRPHARLLYLPAPVPPLYSDAAADSNLEAWLSGVAHGAGATILPREAFSLGSYLSSGFPLSGAQLGAVAEAIVGLAEPAAASRYKVLVTDFDNVMWHGVIGEDGVAGIQCSSEGAGYRFFLYQTLLAKLEREGVLLAGVSRNDPELALQPFRAGRTTLLEEQLVCVLASYHAKSAQIAEIASRLNLGLDAFVFVDDNPLELAEVQAQLPAVRCVPFPAKDEQLPVFFAEISTLFSQPAVTEEDRGRTELYRRRMVGVAPSTVRGADLTAFLRNLEMSLTIHDRSAGDRTRAVQLINKTNQFNLNGRRVSDEEVGTLLAGGGRLFTATLSDQSGSHGEILACLISADGVVESLVMSCRVFQRRVEHAFVMWLAESGAPPARLRFQATERNEPIQQFLENPAFHLEDDGCFRFDAAQFAAEHADHLALFHLHVPETAEVG